MLRNSSGSAKAAGTAIAVTIWDQVRCEARAPRHQQQHLAHHQTHGQRDQQRPQ